ncbi:hypothetical protein acsn021_05270 [Anaerocolumna cellulosilytica]|uniref:Uncharacterized protein n=1 Tax=Anaerocolumna cellulosilytica TaxID=433286 RepID=A0A6S6R1T0_9FIRM|nr:TylF/MycF/NovP-related O-methyltransferase [Anaerocolumna cellulosilytica]MBB5195706.1 hypothetical protein [Anaerocolumna cellulosilytica]BCJ92958.1 hypothetical protein acsn021_05270 [Anaerocolumna cellulosilytica]
MKILLWGCGERCQFFIKNKYLDLDIIIGFIDNNSNLTHFFGKKVYRPDEIYTLSEKYDFIIVTTNTYTVNSQILNQLEALGLPSDKILFIYNNYRITEKIYIKKQNDKLIKAISEELYYNIVEPEKLQVERLNDTLTCSFDLIDNQKIVGTGSLNNDLMYMKDYTRYRTFELTANEIENRKLEGAVAEVGVFRGMFAEIINLKFPDRKLYLFDSFESFKPEEYEKERESEYCEEGFKKVFENTSVDIVMKRMPYPDNCIVRKGFFPESIQEQEQNENFAFISIDVDFEESTYQCLSFFYPRLVKNGYIFLHDYNNRNLEGVKVAVNRYEADNKITFNKIPLCDEGGTLIIIK